MDWESGSADGANLGTTTKQDVVVAAGVLGTMAGVGIMAELTSVVGVTGYQFILPAIETLNNFDDIFTNQKLESGLQQLTDNKVAKNVISVVKTTISLNGTSTGFATIKPPIKSPFQIEGATTDGVSFITTIINSIPEQKNNENTTTNEKQKAE